MQLALLLIGSFLAAVLFLVLLVLALPVDIRLRLSKLQDVQFSVEGRPLGGWGPWIEFSGGRKSHPKRDAKPKTKRKKRRFTAGRPFLEIAKAGKDLFFDVLDAVSLQDLSVDCEFGTGDPAETGTLFGYLAPLIYTPCGNVSIKPNFDAACLQGNCTAVLRFTPLALLMPLARFGWIIAGPRR